MKGFIIKKNIFFTITLPLLLWTALMFTVSTFPGKKLPEVSLWQWDKLAHCAEFIIFSILLIRYLYLGRTFTLVTAWKIGIIIGIVYAGLDELHQIPIPNRCCTWQDFVADMSGVVLGTYIAVRFFKRKAGI